MGLLSFIKKIDPIGYAGGREGLRLGQQVATLNNTLPNPLNINEKNGKIAWQPTRGALPPPAPPMGPGPAGPTPGAQGVGLMTGMPQQADMIARAQSMMQQPQQPMGQPPGGAPMRGMLPAMNGGQEQGGGLLRIRNFRGGY